MEDPRIRKLARFLIRGAVELKAGEKILIELHGSETGLMKALVQEAFPDREIVVIDCRPLLSGHGSLHCVTMQFPEGYLRTDR